jgi:hypothetical protein
VFHQRERQLGWMAFVVMFIFWVWIYQVRLLLALFLGFKSFSSWDRLRSRWFLSTPEGWGFLMRWNSRRGIPGDRPVFHHRDCVADACRT